MAASGLIVVSDRASRRAMVRIRHKLGIFFHFDASESWRLPRSRWM
jgi:hypothetical protein